MGRLTYFVVQPYVPIAGTGLLGSADPVQVPDAAAARRMVQALPKGAVGAVAFSRSGDTDEGEWDDAVIIASNGRIPENDPEAELPW